MMMMMMGWKAGFMSMHSKHNSIFYIGNSLIDLKSLKLLLFKLENTFI